MSAFAKFLKWIFWLILLPVVLLGLYTWASLSWVYSDGERIGYVQKLSHKGWVCKTWEGELVLVTVPGTQAEKFYFTVRDPAVISQVNQLAGERVRVMYKEHKGVPSTCFGETSHYVYAVEEVEED
ncbi:hypothetical protein [Methylophilus medardicus]|uniref:6-phosphogluconate dehydrogenase n=1 Tax=Methylophilus medardicus TaxID=2588534 RepID=A0A5B8CT36_9PROT|nr:hypothetical protein [Methylophilus medardicus]QDC44458.1 hypothetical protein FIU01_07930 [Methylophilus medardicus]QDC49465.1 hypothetical protein FIU00_07930 [Methylophilus medardicus]QDC53170.1 hypothetical protein FIT99_07930 [Methylophilus medardicus]